MRVFSTWIYGLSAKRAGKTRFNKLRYRPRKRSQWDIFIISLGSIRGVRFRFKRFFELAGRTLKCGTLNWPIMVRTRTERYNEWLKKWDGNAATCRVFSFEIFFASVLRLYLCHRSTLKYPCDEGIQHLCYWLLFYFLLQALKLVFFWNHLIFRVESWYFLPWMTMIPDIQQGDLTGIQ